MGAQLAPQVPVRLCRLRVRHNAPVQPDEADDRPLRSVWAGERPQACHRNVGEGAASAEQGKGGVDEKVWGGGEREGCELHVQFPPETDEYVFRREPAYKLNSRLFR